MILCFSPGDPLKLDKNSSTARVVGVRARGRMVRVQGVEPGWRVCEIS